MYKCNKTSTLLRLILSRFLNPRTQGKCPGSAHGILECLTSRITVTLLLSVHMKCYAILYKHVTVHIKKSKFLWDISKHYIATLFSVEEFVRVFTR